MAYKVAQLRKVVKQGGKTYMVPVNTTPSEAFYSSNKFGGDDFQDFCLTGDFEAGQVYYLRFMIHRIPEGWYSRQFKGEQNLFANADDMTITLLLKRTEDQDENDNPPQIIDTFTIESLAVSERDIGANTKYYSYTTVFIPARSMGVLGFRLTRTAYDALAIDEKGNRIYRRWLLETSEESKRKEVYKISGEEKEILYALNDRIIYSGENGDICRLKNIISQNSIDGSNHWLKMGFQSRPGTLIVVNKCPIRVGRSGIYEINNGMIINSFMVTAPQGSDDNKIDAFLLDYAYDKN